MKRFFIVMILSALLIGVMFSTAAADALFKTCQFEFILPDSWYYEEAALTYARCKSSSGNVFQFYESNIEIPEKIEDIADFTADYFGAKDYVTDFEEAEIAGQKTALVGLQAANKTGYMTMIRKSGRTIGAFFVSSSGKADKEFIVSTLSSVQERPKKDVGFFNYGNAEANLKEYSIKTVGKKKYLILELIWRNVGDAATMFAVNVGVKVYQDGIELHEGFLLTEQTEVGTSIMPGKEITVKEIFELRSSSGKLDIIVDKLMDFTDEIVDRNYSFTLK